MPILDTETQILFPTPCEFITGAAGTGKSHTIRERQSDDPDYAIVTGSTGIAAVNLNSVTINSLLKFFDTDSLRDEFMIGGLIGRIVKLRKSGVRNVVLDEVSMFSGDALDILVSAFDAANSVDDKALVNKPPIGLIIVGDFCQLPPIKAKFAFEGASWHRFHANTTRLQKNWRQGDGMFLEALNAARAGRGNACVDFLSRCGVEFEPSLDMNFDGTTILAKNDKVDGYNNLRLGLVNGKAFTLQSERWAFEKMPNEWKNIPDRQQFKLGAYVMILANGFEPPIEPGGKPRLIYANGDCGHIENIDGTRVAIRLVRNGQLVFVDEIIRSIETKHRPENLPSISSVDEDGNEVEATDKGVPYASGYLDKLHYDPDKRKYITAQIAYYPLRLAYGSTVHKTQGLSLDRVQIDFRDGFMCMPGMGYVALSRCRTAQGLRLVGSKALVAARVKVDQKVEGWL